MFDTEFAKYISTLGIGGILAVIFYYQARKDSQDYANTIKTLMENEKGRTELLMNCIKENSINTNTNTTILQSLHRRLDKDERDRNIRDAEQGRT